MDETLIHAVDENEPADTHVTCKFSDEDTADIVGINIRPGALHCLEFCS